MSDFVICVPTYNRPDIFKTHTYKTIASNNLTDRLYIFVTDDKQKALYEDALHGLTYKEIRVRCNGEPELWKAYGSISASFPVGQKILWMEDKVNLYCLDGHTEGQVIKDTINLKYHVEHAFNICEEQGLGSFTLNGQTNYRPNKLFLKDKPWGQIGFNMTYGSISGFFNHPELFKMNEDSSVIVDVVLSLRYLQKYKASLKYNYLFYTANWFKTPGGLSSEYTNDERCKKSLYQANKIIEDMPDIRCCVKGVCLNIYGNASISFKTKTQLKKVFDGFKSAEVAKPDTSS